MKRSMSILLSLMLVMTTVIAVTPRAFADDSDVVPDLALREAINRELGLGYSNTSPVSKSQVESLTSLNAAGYYSNSDITSLEGLQYAANLTELNFDANQVSDISKLSGLTNLTTLSFEENQVSDISALSGLTNLENLEFEANQVSDISALSGLTKLENLNFNTNQVSTIGVLSSLTNLKKLSFDNNQVSNISVLSGLTNLEWLYFYNNEVSDISVLSGLTNLSRLSFGYNQVSDISVLSGLTNLERLFFDDNQVNDISVLSGLTELKYLFFYNNEVSDISVLSGFTKLKYLDFSENEVSDITSLSGLTNLEELYFHENQVSDISSLSALTKLEKMDFSKNNISDIGSLNGLTALRDLYFNDNQINDISVLSGLTNLKKLDFSENKISDISVLSGLTNLEWLYFYNNEVSDISALSGLTNLEWLYFYNNEVSDISSLSGLTKLRDLSFGENKVSDISPIKDIVEANNTLVNAASQKIEMFLDSPYEFENLITGKDGELLDLSYVPEEVSKNGDIYKLDVNEADVTWSKLYDNYNWFIFGGTITARRTVMENPEEPIIEGYNRVEFKDGTHGSLNGITLYAVKTGKKFSEVSVPSVVPNTNYTFDGWNPALPGGTEAVTADMTFTAKYKMGNQPVETFTVKFEPGENGSLTGTTEFTVNEGEMFSVVTVPNVNPSEGYTFDGWNPELPGGTETITKDMTFTAKYSKDNQETEVSRLSGKTRFETAVAVSKEMHVISEYVIIVNGRKSPDALAATPLAKPYDAPILLVEKNDIPVATRNEIERLGASKAIIVGGKGVVSESVENELEGMGLTIERYSGKDRYKTSLAVAEKVVEMTGDGNLVLAKGTDFPDALTVSSLALKEEIPILLTNSEEISTEVKNFIETQNPTKLYIAGGKGAVSLDIENDIEDLGIDVKRFSGKDRYETGKKIAEYAYPNPNDMVFANGRDFADAMVGGPLTTVNGGPVMLVEKTYVPKATKDYMTPTVAENVNKAYIVGGEGVIPEAVEAELTGILD